MKSPRQSNLSFRKQTARQSPASLNATKRRTPGKNDTIFHRDSFELLENILEEAGELKERIPYEKLVTTTYSEKAAGLQNE